MLWDKQCSTQNTRIVSVVSGWWVIKPLRVSPTEIGILHKKWAFKQSSFQKWDKNESARGRNAEVGVQFKRMKRERNKKGKKQRRERHGRRIKDKRDNYREQEVIEKASRRVQTAFQAVKGGNVNNTIRKSFNQSRRRNWAYLCELEGLWRRCPGQENVKEAEMLEKERDLGRVSLLSARKGDGSPRFCVCVLCTFSTWSEHTREWGSRQLFLLRTWTSGIRPKKRIKRQGNPPPSANFSFLCLSHDAWPVGFGNITEVMQII